VDHDKSKTKKLNTWTMIIYHSGDADLGEEFVWSLKEMMRVGAPEGVEVCALLASVAPELWQFTIKSGSSALAAADRQDPSVFKTSPVAKVQKWSGKPEWATLKPPKTDPRREDVAAATVLRDFVKDCIENHPAHHYMLVLSGHGAGMIGQTFLRDQGAGRFMTIPRLSWALGQVVQEISEEAVEKKKENRKNKDYKKQLDPSSDDRLDILGLDACGMMTAEVAHLLGDDVRFLVGSEGFMTLQGWPYHLILEYLNEKPNAMPEELATESVRRIVRYYNDFARVGRSIDMAACDLDPKSLGKLTGAIRRLTRQLLLEVANSERVVNGVIAAHWYAQSYALEDYVDLYDFCDQLRHTCPGLAGLCRNVMEQVKAVVKLSCYAGAGYQQSHGVSIYFPWDADIEELFRYCEFIPRKQRNKPATAKQLTPFNKATRWGEFINTFIKETRRKPRLPHDGKGEAIFMPPAGYLEYINDPIGKTFHNLRTDRIEHARMGTIEDARMGTIEDARMGTIEDARMGTIEDARMGTVEDAKNGLGGLVKIKNVALEYYEDKCGDNTVRSKRPRK
jgi:hypothetical protein